MDEKNLDVGLLMVNQYQIASQMMDSEGIRGIHNQCDDYIQD